jgi:hypothetical protein
MTLTRETGALLVGLSLLAPPACSSHYPGAVYHHGDHWDVSQGRDRAYDRGYHDGVKAGMKDWRRERRFDVWRHRRYRNGDSGYRSRYGPPSYYRRAYRAGFRAGYRVGYGPSRGWYRRY